MGCYALTCRSINRWQFKYSRLEPWNDHRLA
ncbi:MAG: hypothetical protein JWM19_7052 [Actinomycetia bacterium]|nr:hypothetical protein [Actinomycetes bacterium]